MLNTEASAILQEIKSGEQLRKAFLANTAELVRRYVGNWYRNDTRGKPRPENLIYTFVGTMLPNLVFNNPGVTVTAKRSITQAAIARAMEMALNGWVKDVKLRDELEGAGDRLPVRVRRGQGGHRAPRRLRHRDRRAGERRHGQLRHDRPHPRTRCGSTPRMSSSTPRQIAGRPRVSSPICSSGT